MNFEDIIIPAGVGVFTGLLGFFGGRAKNEAETKKENANALGVEIANLRLIIESWRDHSVQLEAQIDKQDKIIQEQNIKINDLQSKVNNLTMQIEDQCRNCNYKK